MCKNPSGKDGMTKLCQELEKRERRDKRLSFVCDV
jgi:hypothetical protein